MTYFDLEHDTLMLHMMVGGFHTRIARSRGWLSRLKAAIDANEMIALNSATARQLTQDAVWLRELADQVEQCRERLIENGMPKLRLIAAE